MGVLDTDSSHTHRVEKEDKPLAEEGKIVNKKWGKETYYTNTDKFCCKELVVNPMSVCSKHRHLIKDEMFHVLAGEGFIEVNDRIYYVTEEDHLHIPHGTWHRFWTVNGMELLEISTHHDDKDVERDVPSDKLHTACIKPTEN